MTETHTIHDPFLGKDVEISDRLTDRLRGKYANGPTMPNGEPEFGWREFPVPPIQKEAADEIDRLEALLNGCQPSLSPTVAVQTCNCLECRIRAALSGGDPTAPFEVEINGAIIAMGEVLSELLAHVPAKAAKKYAAELLVARKNWQAHPRVMAQQPHRGTA